MGRPDWDKYFMEITEMVATRTTCSRRSVGAVIIKENRYRYKDKNIKGEEIEYPCTRLMITVILNTAEEQVEGYREIEGRILKTETLYNGVKGKSYCIVSGKEENEVMNEEFAKEEVKKIEEDDLLAGLDEINK